MLCINSMRHIYLMFTAMFMLFMYLEDTTTKSINILDSKLVLNVLCFLLGNSPTPKFYIRTFRNAVCSIFTPTCPWKWKRYSLPKRQHLKFRRRGINQKKAYCTGESACRVQPYLYSPQCLYSTAIPLLPYGP